MAPVVRHTPGGAIRWVHATRERLSHGRGWHISRASHACDVEYSPPVDVYERACGSIPDQPSLDCEPVGLRARWYHGRDASDHRWVDEHTSAMMSPSHPFLVPRGCWRGTPLTHGTWAPLRPPCHSRRRYGGAPPAAPS